MTFAQFISEGFYRLALVSESFIEENKDQFGDSTYVDYFDYCERQIAITGGKDITDNNNGEHRFYNYNMVKVYNHGSGSQAPITMFDSTKTSLANKEIILSLVDTCWRQRRNRLYQRRLQLLLLRAHQSI